MRANVEDAEAKAKNEDIPHKKYISTPSRSNKGLGFVITMSSGADLTRFCFSLNQ